VRAGYDPFLTGHRVVLSGGRGWTYHLAVGGPIAWPLTRDLGSDPGHAVELLTQLPARTGRTRVTAA
jgi:hypothetical protein